MPLTGSQLPQFLSFQTKPQVLLDVGRRLRHRCPCQKQFHHVHHLLTYTYHISFPRRHWHYLYFHFMSCFFPSTALPCLRSQTAKSNNNNRNTIFLRCVWWWCRATPFPRPCWLGFLSNRVEEGMHPTAIFLFHFKCNSSRYYTCCCAAMDGMDGK